MYASMHINNPPASPLAQMHQLHMPLQRPTKKEGCIYDPFSIDIQTTSRIYNLYIYILYCFATFSMTTGSSSRAGTLS